MYIKAKDVYSFDDLKKALWDGAIDTLDIIEEKGKESELMRILPNYFSEEIPTIGEINDLLCFKDRLLFEALGINNKGGHVS